MQPFNKKHTGLRLQGVQNDSWIATSTRFPSSPWIIRVPFFLLFGSSKETQKEKGKRVLLGNLAYSSKKHAESEQPCQTVTQKKTNNYHTPFKPLTLKY